MLYAKYTEQPCKQEAATAPPQHQASPSVSHVSMPNERSGSPVESPQPRTFWPTVENSGLAQPTAPRGDGFLPRKNKAMSNQRLFNDTCFAIAKDLLAQVSHLLREEEQRDAFNQFYAVVRQGLLLHELEQERLRRRLYGNSN